MVAVGCLGGSVPAACDHWGSLGIGSGHLRWGWDRRGGGGLEVLLKEGKLSLLEGSDFMATMA